MNSNRLKFEVTSLLQRQKEGVAGPFSCVEVADQACRHLGIRFNRLARITFDDPTVLQQLEEDGLTSYDHLLIGRKSTNNLTVSLWIDLGLKVLPVAMATASDPYITTAPIYRRTSFETKLTDEQITEIFRILFNDPHLLDILPIQETAA